MGNHFFWETRNLPSQKLHNISRSSNLDLLYCNNSIYLYSSFLQEKLCLPGKFHSRRCTHVQKRVGILGANNTRPPVVCKRGRRSTGRKTEEAKIEMRNSNCLLLCRGEVTRSQIEKRLDEGKGACRRRLRSGIPQILVHFPHGERKRYSFRRRRRKISFEGGRAAVNTVRHRERGREEGRGNDAKDGMTKMEKGENFHPTVRKTFCCSATISSRQTSFCVNLERSRSVFFPLIFEERETGRPKLIIHLLSACLLSFLCV